MRISRIFHALLIGGGLARRRFVVIGNLASRRANSSRATCRPGRRARTRISASVRAVMAGDGVADSLTSGGLLSLAGECGPAFAMRLLSVIVLPFPSGEDSTHHAPENAAQSEQTRHFQWIVGVCWYAAYCGVVRRTCGGVFSPNRENHRLMMDEIGSRFSLCWHSFSPHVVFLAGRPFLIQIVAGLATLPAACAWTYDPVR